ncbi:myotubularin-related protein 5-like [Xenia sp. Carnegie-2017]|uniref:myotubularin-related protein 5-like n=1 Tax=Xenia sp. Carnegie-2017 TaxID=2897299 RepID=UPI001F04375A|nr:myotubularin-related protein 5-like [Xenia sp. Carnegie-2017]
MPTDWVSPVVIVPKRDGNIRLCVDMRIANTAIKRTRHPIPTVEAVSMELNGARIFSKLDLAQAYHQLELCPASHSITTFSTHCGLYRYKRLNYGTNAAAELFQHNLQETLLGIKGVKNIADDIIVFGSNRADNDRALDEVLARLQDHNLTLNCQKSKFLKKNLEFFGLLFSEHGVCPDPKKALPSVQRALKSHGAQLALCQELAARSEQHRAVLEHDQFVLVITLMNCALQDDASLSDGAVASALLPLMSEFCRNLKPGVMQFAYPCVQEHPIWQNPQFWEETFFSDVQTDIKHLYDGTSAKKRLSTDKLLAHSSSIFERLSTPRNSRNSLTQASPPSLVPKKDLIVITKSGIYPQDVSDSDLIVKDEALDIAAKQLGMWETFSKDSQKTYVTNEESIVFSKAIHFVNRMVYLMIPLSVSQMVKPKKRRQNDVILENTGVGSVYGDVHAGDHWEDDETDTIINEVTRFVIRFMDRVGTVAGISTDHLKSLYSLVPSVVTMHTESLEPVYREYKQLAPIRKAKIIRPAMLPLEEMQMDGLRCYLIPDGRETGTCVHYGGPVMFPAEGAVFVTNYRIIFKGTPLDEFASEMIVTGSFPIGSLVRDKKLPAQYLRHLRSWLQECVQLRSATFQTHSRLKKRTRNRLQIPPAENQPRNTGARIPRAVSDIRKEAKQARGSMKRGQTRNGISSPRLPRNNFSSDGSVESMSGEQVDGSFVVRNSPVIENLNLTPYCEEYKRLGFGSVLEERIGSKSGSWRLSMVNLSYAACRSYPAVLVVPQHVTDDSLLRVSKNHRHMRFPVATWRHKVNKFAVLWRSSAIERSSVASIIHSGVAASGGSTDAIRSSNVEQDKYLSALVSSKNKRELMKNKAEAKHRSLAANVSMSKATMNLRSNDKASKRVSVVDSVDKPITQQGWEPAALYVFGDKSNLKNLKKDSYLNIDFVPIEIPDVRDLKTSLRKLFKVCCPSNPPKDLTQGDPFFKSLQDTDWLKQLSLVLRISGAVVDLLDIQGSSVLVSFEDGWDITTQILRQYPLSFEFNEYYLHFLAYHHVSMRFRTFLLDSEHERVQMGWLSDAEKKDAKNSKSHIKSLWDYIDMLHKKSSLFYNFKFSKEHSEKVLRPHCNVSNLKLWSYFVSENVSTGPEFDQEVINETETAAEEGQQKLEDKYNANRSITTCNF